MSLFDTDETSATWVLVSKFVIGLVMVFLAPVIAWVAIPIFISACNSVSWPAATGTITRADVVTTTPGGRRGIEFDPIVEYQYQVAAKSFVGNSIAFRGYASPNKENALDVVAKYAVGSRHPVYYKPSAPSESVLEPGTHWLTFLGPLVPLVLLTAGGFVVNDNIRILHRRFS
jgi:Protein of unknown function (DUF3592)